MNEFFSTLLQAVLVAAVPVIAAFASKGFVALAQYLGVKVENATFAKYADQIAKAVSISMPKDTMKRLINQEENRAFVEQVDKLGVSHVTAVIYVAQTYVDELKKSGTFTEENQKIAMQKALEVAKKQLTQEALEFIEITYGDITEYLTSKLEAEVKIQKNAPAVLNVIAES